MKPHLLRVALLEGLAHGAVAVNVPFKARLGVLPSRQKPGCFSWLKRPTKPIRFGNVVDVVADEGGTKLPTTVEANGRRCCTVAVTAIRCPTIAVHSSSRSYRPSRPDDRSPV